MQKHLCQNSDNNIHKGREVSLPFKCGVCKNYLNQLHLAESREECSKCGKNVCIYCQVNSIDKYEDLRGSFPDLPKQTKEGQYKVIKEAKELPEQGLIVSLREKKKQIHVFKKVKRKNKLMRRKNKGGEFIEMEEVKD